jgi:hypothetical protein
MLMPLAQHDSLLQCLIPLTPLSKGEEEGCHAAGWRRPSPKERGSPATAGRGEAQGESAGDGRGRASPDHAEQMAWALLNFA